MRKLIMLGNGFDLAHGFPTSYQHFIEYCTSSLGLNIYQSNAFLSRLLKKHQKQNWIDIEQEYYEDVKGITLSIRPSRDSILRLNSEFGLIQKYLVEYLSEVNKSHVDKLNPLETKLPFEGIFIDGLSFNLGHTGYHLVLNFNYTSTFRAYDKILLKKREKLIPSLLVGNYEIIHIHGQLNSEENPIIFGYGDDSVEEYSRIENLNDNEYFSYFKAFQYLRTQNYKNLVDFVNSAGFEVWVIGMSCGLSDRVMLKNIFENKNCKSIRVFYHKDYDNYQYIIRNISRHFTHKQSFREKVVSFDKCSPCPQRK